jgi:hypothetical protein
MGLLTRLRDWQTRRKERRIAKLTELAADLRDDQQYDLLFLHRRGFVRARGSGQSISAIYADVENLIRKRVRVVIKPGTYFVSSGGHQNMATTTDHTFTLHPCATEHLKMSAACINANRPIPGKSDKFRGIARLPDEVSRFLEAAKGEHSMVIQAGVWTLTDKYSRHAVINHLISRDNRGNTSHPITHEHCDKAKEILERLGIPHRLWYSEIPYERKTVKYADGTYTGEYKHGERHGRGRFSWAKEGDIYDGEWRDDKRAGEGIYTAPNGYKYAGNFLDGQQHGQGKATYSDGGYYEGQWAHGRETGGWLSLSDGTKVWVFRGSDRKFVVGEPPRESAGE